MSLPPPFGQASNLQQDHRFASRGAAPSDSPTADAAKASSFADRNSPATITNVAALHQPSSFEFATKGGGEANAHFSMPPTRLSAPALKLQRVSDAQQDPTPYNRTSQHANGAAPDSSTGSHLWAPQCSPPAVQRPEAPSAWHTAEDDNQPANFDCLGDLDCFGAFDATQPQLEPQIEVSTQADTAFNDAAPVENKATSPSAPRKSADQHGLESSHLQGSTCESLHNTVSAPGEGWNRRRRSISLLPAPIRAAAPAGSSALQSSVSTSEYDAHRRGGKETASLQHASVQREDMHQGTVGRGPPGVSRLTAPAGSVSGGLALRNRVSNNDSPLDGCHLPSPSQQEATQRAPPRKLATRARMKYTGDSVNRELKASAPAPTPWLKKATATAKGLPRDPFSGEGGDGRGCGTPVCHAGVREGRQDSEDTRAVDTNSMPGSVPSTSGRRIRVKAKRLYLAADETDVTGGSTAPNGQVSEVPWELCYS